MQTSNQQITPYQKSDEEDQQAQQLFDDILLSQEQQLSNDHQQIQQSINMKDYKIKKSKKEKKKLKKIKKIKQIKQKAQVSKMKIQSDEDQKSKAIQNMQSKSENSQQYSLHLESNSESEQAIKKLNPNSQNQDESQKPKRLMQDSKKWIKQKLIVKSSAKKKRIQNQEGFRLDQLGNDGIIDQLNQSVDEDDDSFSDVKKSKKKNKKQKVYKQKKQKLTNEQLYRKLGDLGCAQSEQELDSQRYNVDSGIQNVHRMKNKRQQKKSIKLQNKLFGDINLNIDKQNGQMPPSQQQNLQLQLKPKVSQRSICSSFLSKIETLKKTRGLQANVDQDEFQRINKQKNKKSITKLVSKLNDQIQKDEEIDLMVRVPSFSRGKSADIINNTLYIKTYSQNNKIEEKIEEIQIKKQSKTLSKNSKNKPISRSEFFKSIKSDVQLRRSKYISEEELVNNIKKTNLQELQQIRIKLQQKRRKEAMIQLGEYDDADDYIQDLEGQLNQKGVSKQQLRKLIQLQEGIQQNIDQDQNQGQNQSRNQKIQEQQQQKQEVKDDIKKVIKEKTQQIKSKKGQQMDIQPDMIEQFQDQIQNEIKQFQQQKIINESSQSAQEQSQSDNSEMENLNQEEEQQEQLQQKQSNQEKVNDKKIKLDEEQQQRRKQLEEMQEEGIAIKKKYLLTQKLQTIPKQINLKTFLKQDEKENADANIMKVNDSITQRSNEAILTKDESQKARQDTQLKLKYNQEQCSQQIKENENQQNGQHFKEFKKLRKIATIIAQKRQKRQQQLKRAKQFFEQEAQLGSDNQDHDQIVKKINRKEEDDQYDGADLDQQLEELIDNAVDINQENEQAAFKKYMEQQKQKDREELQKILRGEFKRKQIDIQLEEDQKNRNQRRQKMIEWIQKQQQDEADLYAKQSSSQSQEEDSYFRKKTYRKNKKSKEQDEQLFQQMVEQQEENKEDINKKLQMYLEDSISPSKNKKQKFQAHLDLLKSIPQSKIGQKQVIGMNGFKKTLSNSIGQQIPDSQPPKYSSNSLFGGLFNLTGPSKNHEKSSTTGVKLKKTHSFMNQYLKKTVSQGKKTPNQGIKLPSIFNKAISVKK